MKKNKRKKNRGLDLIMMLIILIGWIYVCYEIYQTYILKEIYRFTLISLICTINFFFIFLSKSRFKLNQRRFIKLILLILVIFESFQGFQINKLIGNVESIVQNTKTSLFISLKENNIKSFKNAKQITDYKIGYLNKDDYLKNTLPLETLANANVQNELVFFKDEDALFSSLFSKQLDMIIVDQDFKIFMSTRETLKKRIEETAINFSIKSTRKEEKQDALNITEPFAIVLAGIDSDTSGVLTGRNDAVIVATFNPDFKTITLTPLQRDLYIKQPCYDNQPNKFGHAYLNGDTYGYPGGGPQCLVDTVSQLLDIPIDRYVATNFKGFVDVIDAIGGLELTLDPTLYPDGLTEQDSDRNLSTIFIPNGTNLLNGEQVLAYSRNRYGLAGGANTRAANQMYVIEQLISKLAKSDISTINKVVSIGSKNSSTNFNNSDIVPFAQYGINLFKSGASFIDTTLISTSDIDEFGSSVEVANEDSLERLKRTLQVNMGTLQPTLPMQIKYSAYQKNLAWDYCKFDYNQEGCYLNISAIEGWSLDEFLIWITDNGFDPNQVTPIYLDQNIFAPGTILEPKNKYFFPNYANIVYVER